MPRVSVIVPNYNHSRFLRQRLDSIFNQTYQDFEVILLDDASTDNSTAILSEYAKRPQVSHYVVNKKNSGSSFKQWQKGIELAKGEFTWIAESDDVADVSFLQKAIEKFDRYPQSGVVACNFSYIDEHDQVSHKTFQDQHFDECLKGDFFIQHYMTTRNRLANASSVVFKKELVKEFDSAILSMRYCGDWLFWVQLIQQTCVYILSEELNFFRKHSNNVSTNAERQGLFFIEGLSVYKYILKEYKDRFPDLQKQNALWAIKLVNSNFEKKVLIRIVYKLISTPNVLARFFYYSLKKRR